MENIIVWGGIITMNLLFVFISPILDSLSDNENKEKLEKKWLKAFGMILIVSKIITYYINKYEIDSKLMLDFINGNLKFIFNKGENPIINLVEIIVNISQSLEIYLGVISVLVAIYIYSISLGDDFKKYVLLTLLGEGKALYLTIFLLVLYFFNISPALFITLSIVIFYELYRMIRETFKIMNTMYFKENWKDKIIPQLMKENNRRNLENIYYELRKRIIKAMLEKDFIVFEEMIFYYKTLLMTEGFEAPEDFIKNIQNNKRVQQQENERAVRFLYEIYIYLLENRDDSLFKKISYLNIELGDYYLMKNNIRIAEVYYSFIDLKYDYYNEVKTISDDEKKLYIFEGINSNLLYSEDLKVETESLKAVLKLFVKLLYSNEYKKLIEYKEILGSEIINNETGLKLCVRIFFIWLIDEKIKKENDEKIKKELKELEETFKEHLKKAKRENIEKVYEIIEYQISGIDFLCFLKRNTDIYGYSCIEFDRKEIQKTLLKLLDEFNIINLSDEFIKRNILTLNSQIKELNLKKLMAIIENEEIKKHLEEVQKFLKK